MKVWCAQKLLDVYSGGVGACNYSPGSACREPSTGPLTEGEDVSNHQREEARVGNHSTTAAVLVTAAKPPPQLTPNRSRLHIPHCPGGLFR